MNLETKEIINTLKNLNINLCKLIAQYSSRDVKIVNLNKDETINLVISSNNEKKSTGSCSYSYSSRDIFRPTFPQSINLYEKYDLDNFPNNIYPCLEKAELILYQEGKADYEPPWIIVGELTSGIYFSLYGWCCFTGFDVSGGIILRLSKNINDLVDEFEEKELTPYIKINDKGEEVEIKQKIINRKIVAFDPFE